MPRILINGKEFTTDFLVNYAGNILNSGLSSYETKTLEFCSQWLTGKPSFSVETSGSTGQPKLIEISREQMTASARLTGNALGLEKNDKALVCLSTNHIAGMMMLVRSFVLELDLTIINPVANPLVDFPDDTVFDFTAMVPLQLFEILKNTPKKIKILNKMKGILVGGAPVNPVLEKKLQTVKAPVFATYGMTETVSHIALKRLNGKEKTDYFTTFTGVKIETDKRQCLTINSLVTVNKTLVTNDRVEILSANTFRWLGRIDNIINSGGFKVQVEKVESALEQALFTIDNSENYKCFVSSVEDEKFGRIIIAVIEALPFSQKKQNQLAEKLGSLLKKYEIPKKIYFINKIILTPTAKIDRRATLEKMKSEE